MKLIGTAQKWAQKRCEAYEIAKLIVHSIFFSLSELLKIIFGKNATVRTVRSVWRTHVKVNLKVL